MDLVLPVLRARLASTHHAAPPGWTVAMVQLVASQRVAALPFRAVRSLI